MGKGLLTLALVSLFVCGGGIFSVDANDLIGKEISNQRMSVCTSSMFEAPAELIKDPGKIVSDPSDPNAPTRKPLEPGKPIFTEPFDPRGKLISSEPPDPGSKFVRAAQEEQNPQEEQPPVDNEELREELIDRIWDALNNGNFAEFAILARVLIMLELFESLEPGMSVESSDGWVVVKNEDGSGYIRNDDTGAYINFGPKGKIINIQWPGEEVFSLEN